VSGGQDHVVDDLALDQRNYGLSGTAHQRAASAISRLRLWAMRYGHNRRTSRVGPPESRPVPNRGGIVTFQRPGLAFGEVTVDCRARATRSVHGSRQGRR